MNNVYTPRFLKASQELFLIIVGPRLRLMPPEKSKIMSKHPLLLRYISFLSDRYLSMYFVWSTEIPLQADNDSGLKKSNFFRCVQNLAYLIWQMPKIGFLACI